MPPLYPDPDSADVPVELASGTWLVVPPKGTELPKGSGPGVFVIASTAAQAETIVQSATTSKGATSPTKALQTNDKTIVAKASNGNIWVGRRSEVLKGIKTPPVAGEPFGPPRRTTRPLPAASPHRVSPAGIRAIAHYEGYRNHPYNDNLGNATIGYGHLLHKGPVSSTDVKKWGTITPSEANKILVHDTSAAAKAVRMAVKVHLNQAQFDALTSFAFNVGVAGFEQSQALSDLNRGRYDLVPGDLLHWDHDSAGNVVPGLFARRKAEGVMFAHGIYPHP